MESSRLSRAFALRGESASSEVVVRLSVIALFIAAASMAPLFAQETAEVRLLLNWFPEAEHGGFYAALVHGYFAEAGLRVTILPGGPDAPTIPRAALGNVEFVIENADQVLMGRSQGAAVVAVFAALQHSPRCIMVHAASGIERFDQLTDLTLAMSPKGAFSHFIRRHAPLTNVRIVPYTGNVTQFLLNPNYAQQGYVFSEPYVARQQGADPRVLMVSELGFDPYTSVLVTSEKLIAQQPDVVRRMVRACARGWSAYLSDPERTNEYIHRQNPEMSLEALAYGAEALAPLVGGATPETASLGAMTAERWETLARQLTELELIKAGTVHPSEAFTNRFLLDEP